VGLLKKARTHGSLFKLCSPRPAIQELFKVMRLNEILEIHPDVKTALGSFKSANAPKPAT